MDYEDMDKETLIKLLMKKDDMFKKLCIEKEKLNYYASKDTMTWVLNRRSGLELLDKEFAFSNLNNKNLVVCFIDVDGLKTINDNFGHQEGDRPLINTAEILKVSIRKTDFVIRMGGDEFLVVFPGAAIEEVHEISNRINLRLEESNRNNDIYSFSLSYGFCEYKKGMTVNNLIKSADLEMYKKKLQKKGIIIICV